MVRSRRSTVDHLGGPDGGEPVGGTTQQVLEYVGFFGGLGVAIVFLAAFALGRFAVVGVREVEQAAQVLTPEERVTTAPTAVPEREPETARRRRLRWPGPNTPWSSSVSASWS